MKYTSKDYLLPGSAIEFTDENGVEFTGTVTQSNLDGAMIVQPDADSKIPFPVFVWGPAPKAK